jgi:tetratricopeptide (TPR) repeat protein
MAHSRHPHAPPIATLYLVISLCVSSSIAYGQSNQAAEMRLHYAQAQQALAANHLDVAAREFQEIIRLDPHNAEARASLGAIAFNQGNYADALKQFQQSLQLKPELWNAQAFLGMSEKRLGKLDEAKADLEKGFPHLQQEKLRMQAGSDLIDVYYTSGDLDKAAAVLKVLESLHPEDPDTLYIAYRLHSEQAAHALATLVKVAPQSARTREILAQSMMNHSDFPGAVEEYRRALAADPNLPEIHFELGQALISYSTGEPTRSEAEKEFQAALAANPADANAEYELGEVACLRNDYQGASQHYVRALELRPHYVDAQIGMGKALTSLNRPQKALDYLLDAERSEPQNDIVHYRLALAYRKLGVKPEAEREWAAFQQLRKSQDSARQLYQEMQQRPANTDTPQPDQPK